MPDRTVAFVDLAGFVALTEAHGAASAADLVDRFTAIARDVILAPAELVKTIGDAVMLTAPDPASGLAAAMSLLDGCLAEPGFPLARGGIHHGETESRDGDYFGSAVNLAARLASRAAGPQLLLTDAMLPAARGAGLAVDSLGPIKLRNVVKPLNLYAIILDSETSAVIDPVCRMQVQATDAVGRLRHSAIDYWFCSLACAASFAADPVSYVEL